MKRLLFLILLIAGCSNPSSTSTPSAKSYLGVWHESARSAALHSDGPYTLDLTDTVPCWIYWGNTGLAADSLHVYNRDTLIIYWSGPPHVANVLDLYLNEQGDSLLSLAPYGGPIAAVAFNR